MGKGLATCCAIAVAIAFGLLGAARADAAISPVAHTTANTGFGTAGSLTVTKPAGTAAGDLLLLYVSTEGGTAIPIPAGWSTNYSTAAYYGYAIAAYKIAGASEPASYTVNLGTTRKATVALQAWRGVDNVNPLGDVATDGSPFSSTSAPAGSVTTTRVNSLVVVGATWGDEVTSTTPAGVTSLGSVKTSSGSGGLTSHHGYFTQAAAGATPTRTYTSSISTDWGTASTVLQAPPATPTINSSPATPSNGRSPSWSFSVSEAGDTFQCQLNRGSTVISAWAACTSAKSYDLSGQPDGTYTFSVRSVAPDGGTGSAATSAYTLDTTAPAAPSFTSTPSSPSSGRSPSWSFTGEAGASFQCQVDRGGTVVSAWSTCTSPFGYSLLAQPDGVYTVSVRATDVAGNTGFVVGSSYTLDTTAPAAPSIAGPSSPGSGRAPSWSFSGEAGGSYQCQLDRGGTVISAWAACTSAKAYDLTAQPDGTYTFSVKQTDQAGNAGTVGTSNYTLDTTAPAAPVITGPSSPGSSRSPSWSFTGEAGASFQCQLDRGGTVLSAWAACTSAKSYDLTGQPDATYTVSVRATDPAGNTGATATSSYALDTSAPAAPAITSSPASPGTSRTPSWSFTAELGATFQCQLDRGGTVVSAWAACTSAKSYDLTAQPDGAYTISVKATDQAGNTGPATTSSYTLDTTAPADPVVTGPVSPGNSRSPSWSFSGEPSASFQCRLDRGGTAVSGWAACTSAKSYDLTGQPDATYTLSVKESDQAGNASNVVTSDYALDTTGPVAPTITSAPATPASDRDPSWSFTSAETGATFQCRLDRGATVVSGWATCTSPKDYDLSAVSDGTYTFSVRAVDQAGNPGASATSDYSLLTVGPGAPTITSTPASPASGRNPAWSFTGDPGTTAQCRLVRSGTVVSDWTACTSPASYNLVGDPDGTYSFFVRSVDAALNIGVAATTDYALDTTAPAAPGITGPATPASGRTPSWSFAGEPGASYQCQLDQGGTVVSAWAACTSGKSYDLTGRGDGTYTFSVKATDAAGNTGVAGTSGYALDTTAPAAPAITGPSSPGSTRSPSWSFTGEAGAAFQCQLDRGGTVVSGWAACTSAKTYDLTGQPDGAYTVSVRATDQAGNTGAVGTSGYTLDTTAPSAPTITSAPSSPGTTRGPSWSFTAEVGATFQCRLDRGATMISAWAPCSSGDTYDLTAQPDGAYTISVKAIDAAGNAGAATTSSYTLDTTAPAASTVTPPASPGNSRTPAWSFTSEAGATYQCQLDRGGTIVSAWAICTSAKSYSLSGQPDGTYTMSVKGADQAGNTSPVSTGDYTLDTSAPSTPSIDSGPGASGSGLNPAWSFSGDPGASFDCRLTDGGTVVSDWATCSTSKTYDLSGASDGTYTFAVRSSDGAGNTGSSATYDYTLVTSRPPAPSIDTPQASPGNTTTPSWDFSISEAGDTTECKLARGASVLSDWTACTRPHAYDLGGQPDGTYTFSVRGKNGVGTLGPETAADYVLDTQSPSTPTISASPASPGRSSSPSWSFAGDAGASFQCKIDRGGTIVSDWASCSSPKSYDLSGEADGSYTFSVRALDSAGNASSAATSGYGFDTTAPAPPVFGGTPGAAGTNVTPAWSFTAEPGATLECRLDRGAAAVYGWTACASPRGYDLLSQPDATYTISVRATDQAGNVGTAGANSYQLLTAQPGLPTITSTPGVGGNGRSPAWSFSGDAGALLECRLDRGASAVSDWSTCASPRGFDLTGLPDGAYTFSVRARNFVGTAGPAATSGYVLDTVPPAVPALDASQGAVGRSRRPAWGFSSDAGTLFECQLTRPAHILADWHACASPQSADLSAQPDDDYSFAVRAVDSVGNRSAARSGAYELDTDPPAAPSIDSSPGAKGTDTSPKWSFSGERGATFECKLSRVDDWSACTSPRSYDISKQGAGDYTFSVRATDKAGNTGPAKTDDYTLQASSSSGGGSSDSPAATPPAADTPASKGPDQTPSTPSNSKDATTRAQAKRAERAAAKAGTKSLHQLKTTLAHVLPHISAPRGTQAAATPAHKAHKTAAGKAVAAVAQNVKRAAAAVAKNADKSVFPGSLMFIVFGFLSIQGRIDRNDPKLALAPTYDEPDLGFDPPPSDK